MTEPIDMNSPTFPKDYYVKSLVRLLDAIKYKDTNFTRDERVERLQYAYKQTAKHFAQPRIHAELKFDPKKLEAAIRTISLMVIDCWVALSKQEMADLTIYYTYALILDDSGPHLRQSVGIMMEDLAAGRRQKHPWLRQMNEHLVKVTSHYGPFCSLGIYRSTIDCRPSVSHLLSGAVALILYQFSLLCRLNRTNFRGSAETMNTPSFYVE